MGYIELSNVGYDRAILRDDREISLCYVRGNARRRMVHHRNISYQPIEERHLGVAGMYYGDDGGGGNFASVTLGTRYFHLRCTYLSKRQLHEVLREVLPVSPTPAV